MPLYWLCYRHNNHISVVIEPGASLVHARMRAALDRLAWPELLMACPFLLKERNIANKGGEE